MTVPIMMTPQPSSNISFHPYRKLKTEIGLNLLF